MEPEQVWLKSLVTGERVPVRLHRQLGKADLQRAEIQWKPTRHELRSELELAETPREQWPESLGWDWNEKFAHRTAEDFGALGAYRCFGVSARRQWQGLLAASALGMASTLEPGKPLVYVHYVESAPWNWAVPALGRKGMLRGAGTVLLAAAAEWSMDEECRGRLGLLALRSAVDFYRKLGFTELEAEGEMHGMRSMELSSAAAEALLAGRLP